MIGFSQIKSRFTLLELLVVIAIIIVLTGILLPAITKAKERGNRIACVGRLKQLGLSIRSYTVDYQDWFPGTFDLLVEQAYLTTPEIYSCPSIDVQATIDADDHVWSPGFHYILEHPSFALTELNSVQSGADLSIVADKNENHRRYANVLFSGAHVLPQVGKEWYNDTAVDLRLRQLINP